MGQRQEVTPHEAFAETQRPYAFRSINEVFSEEKNWEYKPARGPDVDEAERTEECLHEVIRRRQEAVPV